LNLDLWAFNRYLKLYQSTTTETPIIESLLLSDSNKWGLIFDSDGTVRFKNIYSFSTITLGDDTKDPGEVVTIVNKWFDNVNLSNIKDLMNNRAFYNRKNGKFN